MQGDGPRTHCPPASLPDDNELLQADLARLLEPVDRILQGFLQGPGAEAKLPLRLAGDHSAVGGDDVQRVGGEQRLAAACPLIRGHEGAGGSGQAEGNAPPGGRHSGEMLNSADEIGHADLVTGQDVTLALPSFAGR